MKLIAFVLAVVLLNGPTYAAVMEATYVGKVFNSINGHTDFGPDESNPRALDGRPYTLSFIYDTLLGMRDTGDDFDEIVGPPYVAQNPILSATLTINGRSKTIQTMTSSVVQRYDASTYEDNGLQSKFIRFTAREEVSSPFAYLYKSRYLVVGAYSDKVKVDLEKPVTIKNPKQLDAPFYGYFEFIDYDDATGLKNEYSLGHLSFESLKVRRYEAEPAPVPLPASGFLMILGMAALSLRQYHCGPSGPKGRVI